MKKPICNKCLEKGKTYRMARKSQGPYDPSTWRLNKRSASKAPKWVRIKKSPLYRIIYVCGCGNRKEFLGVSRAKATQKVRGK
jgi:hypothetical protein